MNTDFITMVATLTLWVVIGGFVLLMFIVFETMVHTEIIDQFFMEHNSVLITIFGFLCGPITIFLPFILYAKREYSKKKRLAEIEKELKRQSCGWWELKEFGGKY